MKTLLAVLLALALLAPAAGAVDLGARAPDKPDVAHAPPPADPAMLRQGGDTIADAVPLVLPVWNETGSTIGYLDDYDEVCPYTQSTSPDVVYSLTPSADTMVDVDLLGSTYDTKVYVYDEDLNVVACNDDFYADYVSKIENLALQEGVTYYVVIDGYGGDAGEYVLNIHLPPPPCFLDCGPAYQMEGEPPLVDGYEDAHNGGCNSPQFGSPFQTYVNNWFCGTSGWYLGPDGSDWRDTDWFEVHVGPDEVVEITVDAEYPTYVFELAPQDCDAVEVVQSIEVGPCIEGTIAIPAEPYTTVWLWIGPTEFEGPVNEYTYTMFRPWWTATEDQSWSAVKGLFD